MVAAAFAELSLPDPLVEPESLPEHRDQLMAFLEPWTEEASVGIAAAAWL